MNKFAIASIVLFAASNAALAQEVEPTPVAAPAVTVIASAEKVCNASFVLTEKAIAACTTKTWPRTVKAGDKFFNTGIGAEFNTLIRQLKN